MIRPAAPGAAVRPPLIPIVPGPVAAGTGQPSGHSDPYKFWSEYYRKHDEIVGPAPRDARPAQPQRQVHRGSCRPARLPDPCGSKNREPWMYIALAIAVEELKGKPEDIKLALNYAADAAQRTHNPNDLVKAADALFLKGYYERVGPLLDEAAAKVPHRSEPLVMSINLARKTKDPEADGRLHRPLAVAGLAREATNISAARRASRPRSWPPSSARKTRQPEAEKLLARLPAAEARDVFIRLHLGRRRRLRPARPGTARRHGPVLDAPHRLRRIDPQERLRQSSRGDLRLPARIRRRLHGPHHDGLYQSRQAADPAHSRDNHPRGTAQEKKQTHTLSPNRVQGQARGRASHGRPAQDGPAVLEPPGGPGIDV